MKLMKHMKTKGIVGNVIVPIGSVLLMSFMFLLSKISVFKIMLILLILSKFSHDFAPGINSALKTAWLTKMTRPSPFGAG
jgi:formate/nitrite transporter FocA (FNT family)